MTVFVITGLFIITFFNLKIFRGTFIEFYFNYNYTLTKPNVVMRFFNLNTTLILCPIFDDAIQEKWRKIAITCESLNMLLRWNSWDSFLQDSLKCVLSTEFTFQLELSLCLIDIPRNSWKVKDVYSVFRNLCPLLQIYKLHWN